MTNALAHNQQAATQDSTIKYRHLVSLYTVCVFFFLKATITACLSLMCLVQRPHVFNFALYCIFVSEQINDDDPANRPAEA